MPTESPLPSSDDADPEKQTTPAGAVEELEEMAAEEGATTDRPDDRPED
jgi:hypothetical protein